MLNTYDQKPWQSTITNDHVKYQTQTPHAKYPWQTIITNKHSWQTPISNCTDKQPWQTSMTNAHIKHPGQMPTSNIHDKEQHQTTMSNVHYKTTITNKHPLQMPKPNTLLYVHKKCSFVSICLFFLSITIFSWKWRSVSTKDSKEHFLFCYSTRKKTFGTWKTSWLGS